ncbi:putative adenosine deaminase [Teladorsagia circumcincta]|uniref:Putative adenosine deaminase n=1 Tax=Teladorsagia circumcincta TaxID=45464 RepID=A0A2G9UQB3_TELCI|nr:putative adenosine deaminase [Teladorsagia circumcincta]
MAASIVAQEPLKSAERWCPEEREVFREFRDRYDDDDESAHLTELHAHLNGSISLETIEKLRCRRSASEKNGDHENCLSLTQPTTMDDLEMVELGMSLAKCNQFRFKCGGMATIDVIKEFSHDSVVYLELRSTPRATAEMSKKEYVEGIINGIQQASTDEKIVTRLLLSVDRRQSAEDAQETLDIAVADESGLIVGLELSGDPSVDGRKFIPLFRRARASGLKVSVHLAEVRSQLEEVDEILAFRPDRIGHGTYLHTNENFVKQVIEHRIPLEICLTSNVMSMTTVTVADSHLRFWREKMVPICICGTYTPFLMVNKAEACRDDFLTHY